MPSDSSGNSLPPLPPPPSSSSNPKQNSNRSAMASFTSPSFGSGPTPPSIKRIRPGFNVERIYEFEAPQFYDFAKQSDPERAHFDEHWFDSRRRTPSSPDFNFVARTSSSLTGGYRPKSAFGKLFHKIHSSGSNHGLSFMNTPIGRAQTFLLTGNELRSSPLFHSHAVKSGLKKSATTENITNSLLSSDFSDPPSTIIKGIQKGNFRGIGSDERKIISGFLSTPLLVIKTPRNKSDSSAPLDLPRSPLQNVTTKKVAASSLRFSDLDADGSQTLFVKETSSFEKIDFIQTKSETSFLIEDTFKINSSTSESKSIIGNSDEKITNIVASTKQIQSKSSLSTTSVMKSVKPLTVPKEFSLGCAERAHLKKLQSKSHPTIVSQPAKIAKHLAAAHKFAPTIPKSPLFASKLRAAQIKDKENANSNLSNAVTKESGKIADLRRRLEYRPQTVATKISTANSTNVPNITVPKSPKLSSIHRNRKLQNKTN